jgi:hypothetical protein
MLALGCVQNDSEDHKQGTKKKTSFQMRRSIRTFHKLLIQWKTHKMISPRRQGTRGLYPTLSVKERVLFYSSVASGRKQCKVANHGEESGGPMSYSQRRTRAWKPTALCIEVVPGGPSSSTSSLDVRIDGLQDTEISDDMTPPSLDDQKKVESRAGHEQPRGQVRITTGVHTISSANITREALDTFSHSPLDAPLRLRRWHILPQEAGGPDMVELTRAMKDDAAAQEDVPEMLGVLLDKTIERNDRLGHVSELTEFESATCNLSASAYLKRIMNYSGCSECCAVVGLLYLQRLKQRVQTLRLTSNNLQRLLLTSVMVAAKFLDDMYYSNKHWAQIGGLSLKDVNSLEMIFLFRLNFDLQMTRETYEEYVAHLLLIS